MIDESGKVQAALLAFVKNLPKGSDYKLSDVSRRSEFRGFHFKRLMNAAKALGKRGLIRYDGMSKVGPITEALDESFKSFYPYTITMRGDTLHGKFDNIAGQDVGVSITPWTYYGAKKLFSPMPIVLVSFNTAGDEGFGWMSGAGDARKVVGTVAKIVRDEYLKKLFSKFPDAKPIVAGQSAKAGDTKRNRIYVRAFKWVAKQFRGKGLLAGRYREVGVALVHPDALPDAPPLVRHESVDEAQGTRGAPFKRGQRVRVVGTGKVGRVKRRVETGPDGEHLTNNYEVDLGKEGVRTFAENQLDRIGSMSTAVSWTGKMLELIKKAARRAVIWEDDNVSIDEDAVPPVGPGAKNITRRARPVTQKRALLTAARALLKAGVKPTKVFRRGAEFKQMGGQAPKVIAKTKASFVTVAKKILSQKGWKPAGTFGGMETFRFTDVKGHGVIMSLSQHRTGEVRVDILPEALDEAIDYASMPPSEAIRTALVAVGPSLLVSELVDITGLSVAALIDGAREINYSDAGLMGQDIRYTPAPHRYVDGKHIPGDPALGSVRLRPKRGMMPDDRFAALGVSAMPGAM